MSYGELCGAKIGVTDHYASTIPTFEAKCDQYVDHEGKHRMGLYSRVEAYRKQRLGQIEWEPAPKEKETPPSESTNQ